MKQLVIKERKSSKPEFREYPQEENCPQKRPYAFVNWQDISGIIGKTVSRDGDFSKFLAENLFLNPEEENK